MPSLTNDESCQQAYKDEPTKMTTWGKEIAAALKKKKSASLN